MNTPNCKRLARQLIEFFTGKRKFPWWEHVREYTEQDLRRLIGLSPFSDFKIISLVFGIHNVPHVPFSVFLTRVPRLLKNLSNYWEVHLLKT
ncbi:MAG: hypothetical protein HYS08_10280 [Chlamydiae bacterium]|nr:hypothetical protein [Chlamydiota bacterium]MBI3266512.1 hypothetical protein [Chlamydiota bacterium]